MDLIRKIKYVLTKQGWFWIQRKIISKNIILNFPRNQNWKGNLGRDRKIKLLCSSTPTLVGRVFGNGPGDLGSVPGRVIPKTFKMALDTSLFNTQQYKVCIEGKVEQSREEVAHSPTPWGSSNWKGSLLVSLDYGHQLYLLHTHLTQQLYVI